MRDDDVEFVDKKNDGGGNGGAKGILEEVISDSLLVISFDAIDVNDVSFIGIGGGFLVGIILDNDFDSFVIFCSFNLFLASLTFYNDINTTTKKMMMNQFWKNFLILFFEKKNELSIYFIQNLKMVTVKNFNIYLNFW